MGNAVMLYLAAAVSDFYIPKEHLSEHKIQSSDGPLNLKLQMVPKMLGPLTCNWIPKAFIVSFKVISVNHDKFLINNNKRKQFLLLE